MSAWIELTLTGPQDAFDALVARGAARVVTDRDLDLAEESLGERLLEAIHLDHHHRVYLPATDETSFLERLGERPSLRLVGRRDNVRGRFSFHAETPSHRAADAIQEALAAPTPEGVAIDRRRERRSEDPTAHGVHLYDRAAHEFVYEVSGDAEGLAPGIFELQRRLGVLEFMDVERLEILAEGGDEPSSAPAG